MAALPAEIMGRACPPKPRTLDVEPRKACEFAPPVDERTNDLLAERGKIWSKGHTMCRLRVDPDLHLPKADRLEQGEAPSADLMLRDTAAPIISGNCMVLDPDGLRRP